MYKWKERVKRGLSGLLSGIMALFGAAALSEELALPAAAATVINNPLIWSDVPDDDIIRVDDTYYMVSTSMFFCPGAPIMKSTNLASWQICNYVYDIYADGDVQNLRNGKHDYAHGQWATSLRYYEGKFYVFFGSYGTGKSYIYSTTDIENGPWSRVELNGMYHDASMLFDDDGRKYLVYGGGGDIKIKEFNSDMTGFKQGGIDQGIFKTGLSGLAGEGSHIHKINGYYYVFVIAWPSGGRRTEYCYRSKNITGPYESKTILNSGLGTYGSGVAQGGVIDTPDGKWYGLMFQDHGAVGRIPVLCPVSWENDWPMMSAPLTLTLDGEAGGGGVTTNDDFDYSSNELKLEWAWNHNPDNTAWSVTDRPGYLRLTNKTAAKSLLWARNTLTMRTMGPSSESIIKLDTTGMKPGDRAGLTAFQFKYGMVGVNVDSGGGKKIFMADNGGNSIDNSSDRFIEQADLNRDEVYFKITFNYSTVNGDGSASNNIDKADFYYSYDGSNWTKIGSTLNMSYDLTLFTGYRAGIFSYNTNGSGGYADIDFYEENHADWNDFGPVIPVEPDPDGYFFHCTYEKGTEKWAARGTATISKSANAAYEGDCALLVSGRNSAWCGVGYNLKANPFTPGEAFAFSASVMYQTGPASETFHLTLQYTDASGEVQYDKVATEIVSKGEWVTLANSSYKIPAGATNMLLYVETAEETIDFYVDETIGGPEGTIKGGTTYRKGDLNGDDVINAVDLTLCKQGLIGGFTDSAAKKAADVNGDGKVDLTDMVQMSKYILCKITEFSASTVTPS